MCSGDTASSLLVLKVGVRVQLAPEVAVVVVAAEQLPLLSVPVSHSLSTVSEPPYPL
jgi:hypothetical protein